MDSDSVPADLEEAVLPGKGYKAPAVDVWPALAAGTRILGRFDLAAALLAATTGEGYVLTGEPESYGDLRLMLLRRHHS